MDSPPCPQGYVNCGTFSPTQSRRSRLEQRVNQPRCSSNRERHDIREGRDKRVALILLFLRSISATRWPSSTAGSLLLILFTLSELFVLDLLLPWIYWVRDYGLTRRASTHRERKGTNNNQVPRRHERA